VELNRFYSFTLILLSLIFGYLAYQVLKPFIVPIIWAIVLTILFYPVYMYISRYVRWRSVAAFLTLVVIILVIIGPFSYVLIALGKELTQITTRFDDVRIVEAIDNLERQRAVAWILGTLRKTFGLQELDLAALFRQSLSALRQSIVNWISGNVMNVAVQLVNIVVMFFSLYFLLRDGPDFIGKIREYLPFPEVHKDRLTSKIKDMVISTLYGGVTVGICQGIIGGITFFALGIGSPVLWGIMIVIMSFVPAFGAFAIWGPAAVYLVVNGAVIKGVILALIGALIISLIDNILKPLIIGGRTKMHTLIIFFSILGGIKAFGLIGLVMGPLVIVITISVFEIFRHIEEDFVIIQSPGPKD